jgi:hypothetical protein
LLTPSGTVHAPLPDVNVTTVYAPLVVVLNVKFCAEAVSVAANNVSSRITPANHLPRKRL